jgi:predicted aldo/keto reductase-like oxidoreductase
MYCNHCLPSRPKSTWRRSTSTGLNELGEGADSVREHYLALTHRAGECIACGSCEANCPFDVPVIQKMEKARRAFGA